MPVHRQALIRWPQSIQKSLVMRCVVLLLIIAMFSCTSKQQESIDYVGTYYIDKDLTKDSLVLEIRRIDTGTYLLRLSDFAGVGKQTNGTLTGRLSNKQKSDVPFRFQLIDSTQFQLLAERYEVSLHKGKQLYK